MSPESRAKTTKKPVVDTRKSKVDTKDSTWGARALNSGIVISNALVQIAEFTSIVGFQHAAQVFSTVFTTIEKVQANQADFKIIADDALELVLAISRLQEKAENPDEWVSPEIRDMVTDLTKTLEEVNEIAKRQTKRNMCLRVIFNINDAGKIRQTREKIGTAATKFQVLSHINQTDLIHEVIKKQQELSEQIRNRNDGENAQDSEEEGEEEPVAGSNSAAIHGFSFTNSGSGTMHSKNVGNIVTNNYSNIGNNRSKNYIYG